MSAQVVTSEDAAEQNKSLQFRLIKSFEDLITEEGISSGHCLEISQRYGVTFILHNGGLRVVESKGLLVNNSLPPVIRNNVEVIGLSSDDSLLAIGSGSNVSIFETKAFCLQPTAAPVRCSFVVSKSGGTTSQLAWNPADTRLIAALSHDGNVLLIRVLDNWSIEAVFASDPSFRCMSWSPKGKQLVVGGTNAIVQLKLDLKEAKKIPLPPGQELVSIHWLSTLQFLATFQPSSRDDLKIMLLTLSKTASPLYKDFGDVFLSDDFSSIKVLSKHIPPWRVHLLGSSTSSDIIVVSHDPSQPTSDMVVQEIDDRYRAALPLDHFCRGIGIYLGCSESVVVNGDDLQACPLLVLLSQKGLVTLFRVVNEGFDSIHVPAAELINIVSVVNPPVVQPTLVTPAPAVSGAPIFGNLNIGAPTALKSSLAISTPGIAHVGAGLSTATSVPSAIFGLASAKSVTAVAPNTGTASLASKNLFGSLPTSTAVPPTFGFTSTSKLEDKSDGIKSSAFGQIVGTQSQGGGGDAPSLVVAPTSFQAAKDTPTPKSATKALEYKHLLEQLKQFHIRYNNFKKLHLQQSKNQLDAINQYFAKLDSQILKDLHKMSDFASDIVETTNGQKEEVDGLYINMQNLFTKIEFGLIAAEKSKDSKYLLLLRAQPIDPVSMAKLTKVEKSYIYLRNQLKEARRHFYYQEQNFRPLQGSMSVDFIFQTMANHALIIQNLHRQALELRRRISEQQIQLITTTGNANVTLDDIASGISHLKLKPNKQDENNILAKPPVVYRKDKLSQLKRWAGHTLITRIPVTGAIDPYLPIAQVRKIRLNPESLTDNVDVQPVVSSAVPEFKQEAKEAAFTINAKIETPKSSLFSAPNNINFSASGATSGPQLSFFSSASSFSSSASTTVTSKPAQILEYPVSTSGGEVASSAFTRAFGTISAPSNFGSTSFSTTTTKSSVFGTVSPPANKQVSIFGGGSVSTASSAISAFSFTSSQAPTSLFSSIQPTTEPKTTVPFPVSTATFPTATATSTVSFITTSGPATSSVLGSQLFGTKSAATTTTTASFFGSASPVSLFGAPKTVEPVSIFASTKTADESLSFGIPKAKDELPVVDSIVTTIGEVKTDVSSIKTAYTLAGLSMTTAPTSTSAVSSTSTSLFGTKAAPLFGQPVVTSSFTGSKPFGSGTSLFGTTTTASSDFGSSSSAFGNASIFGGATQALKTEGTTTPTATATATKMPLFGLPKPPLVTSTLSIEQSDKVAEPITTSLPTPTSTASVVSTIPLATPADSSTTTGTVLPPGSSTQEAEEKQTESVVADSMKAPSAISTASENTSSLFGSMSLTTSAPSLFGSTEPKGVTSIFGGDSSSSGTASIFGKPSTTTADSLFGTTGSSSLFGTPVTAANLFGAPATTANLFGTPVTTEPTTTPSLFASSGATTSLFESPTAAGTTTSPSIFGAPASTSIFGTPAVSVFETNTPTAFGSGSVVSSVTTPSLFGTPTTTAPSTLFGLSDSKPPGASIFGGTPSVFGVSNTSGTDTKQIFGSPATTPATAGQSVFGAPAFGSPGFGTPTAATSPGLFGAPFGSSGTTLIKPAATVFGGAQTGSVFGASATATTTASAFGSSSPTSPAFGGGAVFGGSPAFGSTIKPSSFGSSSIFGGGTSAAGPTFGALAGSGTPAPNATFGTPAVFGSPQQQPQKSAFGGAAPFGSPPAFGAQPQSQSLFGSPAFGATGGSAFGQQQPLSSAFGGGAVFGGSPAFGSTAKTATFGASNTPSIFGGGVDNSNTSFGNVASTQPAFGSSQSTGGFGAAPQSSFGSFNSFGQAPTQPAFGGSAFGGGFTQQDQSQQKQPQQKTASFGGSSFSSWR
ncbi:unnamed protein product [Allacma fusca]|uniref:Nuclear pore complex protein Nup214 n=1 Tax=Allacma fusca TaxID=39272 RepID=A0A8J2KDW3_9HEXA|nr:unnamed protein product [Allacma fusca]